MAEGIYPVFVYGTLLTGESAHSMLVHNVVRTEPATLPNASLINLGAYPMVLPGPDKIHGEACWLTEKTYAATLQQLDRYEGPAYSRELRSVRVDGSNTEVEAWVYIGRQQPTSATALPGGDWRQR